MWAIAVVLKLFSRGPLRRFLQIFIHLADPLPPSHKKKAYNNKSKNNIISAFSTCIKMYIMTEILHIGLHVLAFVEVRFPRGANCTEQDASQAL